MTDLPDKVKSGGRKTEYSGLLSWDQSEIWEKTTFPRIKRFTFEISCAILYAHKNEGNLANNGGKTPLKK